MRRWMYRRQNLPFVRQLVALRAWEKRAHLVRGWNCVVDEDAGWPYPFPCASQSGCGGAYCWVARGYDKSPERGGHKIIRGG